MKSPYRALLWEQARTAGVICLTLGVMSGLFVLTRRVFLYANIMRFVRSQDVAEVFFCFSLAGAGLSVIRQDVRGHITGGIDSRWFRLPIQMPALFSIVVGARVLFLAALVSFQVYIAAQMRPRIAPVEIVLLAILPFYCYLLIQATAWSWKRMPLLWYGLLAALLAVPLLFRIWGLTPEEILPLLRTLVRPHTFVLVPPVLLLILVYGIYLERQDRYLSLPRLRFFAGWLSRPFAPALPTRATAFEAQFWYETRRVGWVLPVFTLGLTAWLVLVLVLVEEHPFQSGLGQYIPLLALVGGSLFAGIKGLFPRGALHHQRPVTDFSIAAARLLAQLRALCIAMALAFALCLPLLLAGPLERSVLVQLQAEGFASALDVFLVIARPLLLAGMLSWLLLWILTGPVIAVSLALFSFMMTSWFVYWGNNQKLYDIVAVFALGFIAIVAVLSLAWFGYSLWRGIASRKQVLILMTLAFVPTLFLWLGSRSLEGVQGFLLAWAVGLCLVLPGVSLSWTVWGRRHDTGLGRLRL